MALPSTARIVFFAANLAAFYLWLLPTLGDSIASKCRETWACRRHIRGTVFGYAVDLADGQWRELRGSMGLLWLCLLACGAVHFGLVRLFHPSAEGDPQTRSTGQDGPMNATYLALQRAFRLLFGLGVLVVQHGYHALIVLALAMVAFALVRVTRGTPLCVPLVWCYAAIVLLFKESYRLRRYAGYGFLEPLFDSAYGGLYGWQFPANFLLLRLVSFALDAHWATLRGTGLKNDETLVPAAMPSAAAATTTTATTPSSTLAGDAAAVPLHPSEYTLLNFSTYVLYAPLYMAGPIMPFDDFVRSAREPRHQRAVPWAYAARWGACLALLEYLTQRFPLFAVLNSGLFGRLSVYEMAAAAYMALKLMWLKFLLIWRFFRLWALVDGIDPPENMLRCMSNNHSLEQFWRGWHASFNRWIIRYLYVPMGGRRTRVWSVWPVFLFVAVWHDIELKLLVWGALNSVFFVLEVAAKHVWAGAAVQAWGPAVRRVVAVLAGATYIIVLVGVNLVGYAVGVVRFTCTVRGYFSLPPDLTAHFTSFLGFFLLPPGRRQRNAGAAGVDRRPHRGGHGPVLHGCGHRHHVGHRRLPAAFGWGGQGTCRAPTERRCVGGRGGGIIGGAGGAHERCDRQLRGEVQGGARGAVGGDHRCVPGGDDVALRGHGEGGVGGARRVDGGVPTGGYAAQNLK